MQDITVEDGNFVEQHLEENQTQKKERKPSNTLVIPVKVIWRFAALSRLTTKNEGHPCERNLEGA
jgi:hypothetical protein